MQSIIIRVTLFFTLTLSSCIKYENELDKALVLSKSNQEVLKQVITHFKNDSLKLKAAKYLISNLPHHYYYEGLDIYNTAIDTFQYHLIHHPHKGKSFAMRKYDKALREISETRNKGLTKAYELEHITSDFLIKNINLSFKAWENTPAKSRINFNQFCEYILPHRVTHEVIDPQLRGKFYLKFEWARKAINEGKDISKVLDQVIDSLQILTDNVYVPQNYPVTMSPTLFEQLKMAKCSDMVVYAMHAFRAIGIPCSNDFTPQWADNHQSGHEWITIHLKDGVILKDVSGNSTLNTLYQTASFSKIYRKTYRLNNDLPLYGNHTRRIQTSYTPRFNIIINKKYPLEKEPENLRLCVFNPRKVWNTVDIIPNKGKDIHLKNLHQNCVYMLGANINGNWEAINAPFIINSTGAIHYFSPSEKTIKGSITRKYPPFRITHQKLFKMADQLNGSTISIYNKNNKQDQKIIHTAKDINNSQVQEIDIPSGKYKFVEFSSNDTMVNFLASMTVLDDAGKKIKGQITIDTEYHEFAKRVKHLIDDKPLTYVGGPELKITYAFDKPQVISKVCYQVRNDDNNIRRGDEYGLYYWDKEWKHLENQIAKEQTLIFNKVPVNSLLWLRNHTRGREEHIFTLSNTGEQVWPSINFLEKKKVLFASK